jgi:NAD(P)-dependent dehydrogenase (short-subunit alcohol dehydrogenase family)
MDLKNQVILITGAGSGMGEATARELARRGAHIGVFDLREGPAKAVADAIGGQALVGDVSSSEAVEQAISTLVKRFGKITGCVNCAGIATPGRVVGREGPMALEAFERVIRVNLLGTFNVMRLAAAQMMQQLPENADGERGVIVNTASIAAFEGQIGQAAYSASKGAVAAMTLPVAREFAQMGIRVVAIAPGVVATPMLTTLPTVAQEALQAAVPFPKRLAAAEEYAQLAAHIFENAYLNGTTIRLDGALRLAPK